MKVATHVVGLLFSADFSHVLLIRKARPPWQTGKLNGVGGRIEPGETAHAAMHREFEEETGCTSKVDWRWFCNYDCPAHGTVMDFFCAADEHAFIRARNPDASEPLVRASLRPWNREVGGEPTLPCDTLQRETVPNLLWLIPMALNLLGDRSSDTFVVEEQQG